MLDEIAEARIWAGLHYRTADLQGMKLGLAVGRYTLKHVLQPVRGHHHHHGHGHHGHGHH